MSSELIFIIWMFSLCVWFCFIAWALITEPHYSARVWRVIQVITILAAGSVLLLLMLAFFTTARPLLI